MAHAGRQDVALTGFTPIRRREWRWIKRRVTEAVGNRSGVVVGGQVEYVIPTAHNRAIPRWQIEALERQYSRFRSTALAVRRLLRHRGRQPAEPERAGRAGKRVRAGA